MSLTFASLAPSENDSERVLLAKLVLLFQGQFVNVKSFGALGDGTTDDTAAFTAALATGRAVFVPGNATYKLTSGITLATAGQQIFSFGEGYLSWGSTSLSVGITVNAAQCQVRGLRLYGTGITSVISTAQDNLTVERCRFSGFATRAVNIQAGADYANVLHNVVDAAPGSATGDYIFRLAGDYFQFRGNQVENVPYVTGHVDILDGADFGEVSGNRFIGNTTNKPSVIILVRGSYNRVCQNFTSCDDRTAIEVKSDTAGGKGNVVQGNVCYDSNAGTVTIIHLRSANGGAIGNVVTDNIFLGGLHTVTNEGGTQYNIIRNNGSTTSACFDGDSNIFRQTNSTSLTNTTTETSMVGTGIGSATLPANFLKIGTVVRLTARGYISTDAAAAGTLTLKFTLGGTTLVSTGAITMPNALANNYFEFTGEFTTRTIGSSGTHMPIGNMKYSNGTTDTVAGAVATSTVTVGTTATRLVDLTAQWGTADTDNVITVTSLAIEVLK